MNKDEYKDHYIAVLRAVKEASAIQLPGSTFRLYLNEESGLAKIPPYIIRDILLSMQDEEMIKIVEYPRMSVLLYDRNPIPKDKPLPDMLFAMLFQKKPQNYYSIQIDHKAVFNFVYAAYLIPVFLYSAIPSAKDNKRYKVLSKIADLLINAGYEGIESYELVANFEKVTVRIKDNKTKKVKLSLPEYQRHKDYYNGLLENRIKTLRKKLEAHGYTIKRQEDILKIAEV